MSKQSVKANQRWTLVSVAELLNLSRSTVSDILNGDQRYSEATRRRVLEAAESLHYQPNRSAQMTRRERTRLIGVLHAGGILQVVNERAYHLGTEIAKVGYELLLSDLQWHSTSSMMTLVKHMIASRVEGFVFSGGIPFDDEHRRSLLNLVTAAGVPSILISAPHLPGIPAVNADFEKGFRDLTKHVLGTGRRRLTLLLPAHPDRMWHLGQRYQGFCRAIRTAGGSLREVIPLSGYRNTWKKGTGIQGEIIYYDGALPKDQFAPFHAPRETMRHLLDQGFTTEGVIASNDEWALAVISEGMARGIALPQTFAVTGFDDSTLTVAGPIAITSASQETAKTAKTAVELLLKKIEGDEGDAKDILVPCPIVIRESSQR